MSLDQAFSQTLKTDRPEGMFSHKIIRDLVNFPCIFPKMSIQRKAGHPNLAKTLAWMSTFFICFTVRIKCRDLVKKIAIYRHRLAVSIEIICSTCLLRSLFLQTCLLITCSFLDICSIEDSHSLLLSSIIMLLTCPFLLLSGPIT